MRWYTDPNVFAGVPIWNPPAQLTLLTDALLTVYGSRSTVSRLWHLLNRSAHINRLELLAVLFLVRHFFPLLQNHVVFVRTDDTTTAAYMTKHDGTKSWWMAQQAIRLMDVCAGKQHHFACPPHRGTSPVTMELFLHQGVSL